MARLIVLAKHGDVETLQIYLEDCRLPLMKQKLCDRPEAYVLKAIEIAAQNKLRLTAGQLPLFMDNEEDSQ